MQHEAGVSPDPWTLVQALPSNLSLNKAVRVTWWPPLYQGAPLAVRRWGLTWGAALKLTIIGCLMLGAAGWWIYFGFFTGKGSAAFLLLVVLCSAFTLNAATEYQGGDLLLWGVAPYVVVLNILAMRTGRTGHGGDPRHSVWSLFGAPLRGEVTAEFSSGWGCAERGCCRYFCRGGIGKGWADGWWVRLVACWC